MEWWTQRTHSVFLLIEKKRGNSPTGVRTIAGLATDMNSSAANAKMVDGAGDSVRRRRHLVVVMWEEITKVVDGETTSQWCSLYPFPVRTIAGPECMDHLTQLRVQPHSHHCNPPLLHPTSQWHYERTPPFVILTHMMSLIRQLFSIYSSWFGICVVTVHGLCMRSALY